LSSVVPEKSNTIRAPFIIITVSKQQSLLPIPMAKNAILV
jgi:hypothetical protein